MEFTYEGLSKDLNPVRGKLHGCDTTSYHQALNVFKMLFFFTDQVNVAMCCDYVIMRTVEHRVKLRCSEFTLRTLVP